MKLTHPTLLPPLVVALTYLFLGYVSLLVASPPGIPTPLVFLPEGVALAAGILVGPGVASGVLLGHLLLELIRGQPWELALAMAAVFSIEVIIGALLARRWRIGPHLQGRSYLRLVLMICLIVQPVAATLGTATLWLWDTATRADQLRQVWLSWWFGHAVAQSVLVPLLLASLSEPWSKIRQRAWNSVLPVVLLLLVLGFALLAPLPSHQAAAGLWFCAPLLVWITGRGGIATASLVTITLVLALLFLTSQSFGPFVGEEHPLVFDLNAFSLGLAVTILVFNLFDAEYQRAESERGALLDQLRITASVFASTQDGILITDPQRRIIDVNAAFTLISGYQRDEVLGRDPKCLASGMTPPEVYADMWQSLVKTGFWRGELINRHKKGHVVAEMIAITAVRAQDGYLSHYVGVISRTNPLRNDPLTGLPSRALIYDHLAKTLTKARAMNHRIALMLLGLDRLRAVNLAYGQAAGDRVLRETAKRLATCLPATAILGRMQGDEYAIVLDELADLAAAEGVVNGLLAAAAKPQFLREERIQVTISLGVAFFPDDAQELKDLLRCADLAFHAARDEGGARCHYYRAGLQQQAQERRWLTEGLLRAVEHGHFRLHYQPIVHLATGAIHKAEALIRWLHPERGLISPDRFIPEAEKMGLIGAIGDWTFKEVLRHVAKILGSQADFQISLNVSPIHLVDDQFDQGQYLSRLAGAGLPGSALVLEITEGLLLEANDRVRARLSACRAAGMQVALDDFGTGYSSLSYLPRFEIDYLKLDKSFVHNLQPGGKEHAICEAIVAMAHRLGFQVIAEGIETEEQRHLLLAMGCDFGQGYLFAEPLTLGELLALLHED